MSIQKHIIEHEKIGLKKRVLSWVASWWNSLPNIDGKNIGATTAGTGRFTTLTTTGNTTLGDSSSAKMTVNGVMGVGIASPASRLHVNVEGASATSGGYRLSQLGSTGQYGYWEIDTVNLKCKVGVNGATIPLTLETNNIERVRITSTGVVRPGADNTQSLGEASFRWSAVHTSGIAFPATQNASADANTLDDYREASYTATATGMTTSPTVTVSFVRTGNSVTVNLPAVSGTSNSAVFALTGGPTTMRPATGKYVFVTVQDNGGAVAVARALIDSAGTITLYKDANLGAFTPSGTKGVAACSFSYII